MASMATMGHCSVYVVLLQTAVEGPGFADVMGTFQMNMMLQRYLEFPRRALVVGGQILRIMVLHSLYRIIIGRRGLITLRKHSKDSEINIKTPSHH